jgi:hypothetical protein
MRIAPLVLVATLLSAGAAHAEDAVQQSTQEYTPPAIFVTGEKSPDVTEKSVTGAFLAAKPLCVAKAAGTARLPNESDWLFRQHQDEAFVFCMAEELAGYGLSVSKDAPRETLQGT